MPRIHHVKKARKDYPEHDIKAGDSYFWWKFRYGGKYMSKTPPKPSQLTQSPYLSTIYSIQEGAESTPDPDDIESRVEEIKDELEQLRDECQGSLDNMPEALQESGDVGNTLTERIECLDSAIDELSSIDVDIDSIDVEQEDDEDEDDYELRVENEKQQRADEIWQEVQDALGNLA